MSRNRRDPWRTASILLAFLTEYNIVLALMHTLTSLLFGTRVVPMDRVWAWRETHFDSVPGYRACFVQLLTAILLLPIEVLQIQRAKWVLDFAMTAQCSHLLLTCLYSGAIPTTWAWWTTWLLSSGIMVFGGEYACMTIELRPISFGAPSAESPAQQASEPSIEMTLMEQGESSRRESSSSSISNGD